MNWQTEAEILSIETNTSLFSCAVFTLDSRGYEKSTIQEVITDSYPSLTENTLTDTTVEKTCADVRESITTSILHDVYTTTNTKLTPPKDSPTTTNDLQLYLGAPESGKTTTAQTHVYRQLQDTQPYKAVVLEQGTDWLLPEFIRSPNVTHFTLGTSTHGIKDMYTTATSLWQSLPSHTDLIIDDASILLDQQLLSDFHIPNHSTTRLITQKYNPNKHVPLMYASQIHYHAFQSLPPWLDSLLGDFNTGLSEPELTEIQSIDSGTIHAPAQVITKTQSGDTYYARTFHTQTEQEILLN